ncbi:MAG TPA: DEAD/DEAH box helicase [Acidiferrobacter sp.]|nr:DEAD/DEAH box helicase [Acidiferrobacter sp.]
MNYQEFFGNLTSPTCQPYGWQSDLVLQEKCTNRLIRIPTGFGKTLGVLAAWLWHRMQQQDDGWPRRLVWCLPMRVLVEQIEQETRDAIDKLGMLWDGESDHSEKVGVHLLMGGADGRDWHLYPEHCAVLIGTQDMLLSRAMNRAYGAPRARWPMEFGLLNQDCLWVMDEVQLMDVGLATSAQLQAFREDNANNGRALRPCRTWWMSATLQHGWLQKSPDTEEMAASLLQTAIPRAGRAGHLWDDVRKPRALETIESEKTLAERVAHQHIEMGRGAKGPTLVVVNTVDRAVRVFEALQKNKALDGSDLRLVHSRFRPHERASWRAGFLNKDACAPNTDRIIIATQVIEAGVDLSAGLLMTDLAPWPNVVQRFGRAARWGGDAKIIVIDFRPVDDKKAAPYTKDSLDAARGALGLLSDVAPLDLEVFEEQHPELLPRLYPYDPKHLLLRHEIDELFDTTPDLSGGDIDISRFIRSGDERDLHVFWDDVAQKDAPGSRLKPSREALCTVPFLKARDWLCGKESGNTKAPRLKKGMRAWVWDWLDGEWRSAERHDLYPGRTVLVAADCGGYDPERGWSPESSVYVKPVVPVVAGSADQADAAQDDESLSAYPWQTIAVHGRETGNEARRIAEPLVPELADLLDLGGRWHDVGKVHPVFNNSIKESPNRPARRDLAKAPREAWLPISKLYPMKDGERRPGFRHELASALALLAVLQRHKPDHEALLGPWREWLEKTGTAPCQLNSLPPAAPNLLEREILSLNAGQFNLLVYLVCSHHGKVRVAWHACPADQATSDEQPRIRGIRDGDALPPLMLAARDQTLHQLPETFLDLTPAAVGLNARTGMGWTERVLSLLDHYGPFTLAWLEALLRAADQRASRRPGVRDELLSPKGNG